MGKLPYDAYIFDLDGTMTQSEPGIVKSVQYALDKLGVEGYDRQSLRFVVGPPLMYSFHQVIGLSQQDAYRAIDLYRERYSAKGWLENSVYTGIPAMLRSLKAQGAYLAVATAKPEHFARKVLDHFGLSKYFDGLAAPRDEDESRFKERLVRRVLPQGARGCMVGDRNLDVQAGQACGLDTVGALYGYGSREELEKAGATYIARDVEHLSCILLGDQPLSPGKFITLEGCDGCGKSTQHHLLAQCLEEMGHQVVVTREPGGCPISERIRDIVLDAREEGMSDLCEALLFAAARTQHVHQVIRPALAAGKAVLCDRFVDSSLVYQGVGRGLGPVVEKINQAAVDGCMPDLTILLDIDPHAAMARRTAASSPDRIEKAPLEFVDRVYRAYRELAAAQPQRYRIVDAGGDPRQVFARIREIVAAEV